MACNSSAVKTANSSFSDLSPCVFGLVLSIPLFFPKITLHILRSSVEQLPSWMEAHHGDVYRLSAWDIAGHWPARFWVPLLCLYPKTSGGMKELVTHERNVTSTQSAKSRSMTSSRYIPRIDLVEPMRMGPTMSCARTHKSVHER